jgi:hypothetical protein
MIFSFRQSQRAIEEEFNSMLAPQNTAAPAE